MPNLDEPERFLRLNEVQESLVRKSLVSWQSRADAEPAAETLRGVTLAHLNLRQWGQALTAARKACSLAGADEQLWRAHEWLRRRPVVMVIDDSSTIRAALSRFLERQGYRAVLACDGLDGLARVSDEKPALVLLDITMPRMDGYQVCRVLRENGLTRSLPVVMLSGKDGIFDKIRGRLAGSTSYVTKPFAEAALLATLRKLLPLET